jgi:hypothetical protein
MCFCEHCEEHCNSIIPVSAGILQVSQEASLHVLDKSSLLFFFLIICMEGICPTSFGSFVRFYRTYGFLSRVLNP